MDGIRIAWKTSNELVSYPEAMKSMHALSPNTVWFLEHDHVYTKGSSVNELDLTMNANVPLYQSNRGGKVTYHGPGQRIVYLVLDLKKIFHPEPPDVKKYVYVLEETIILLLKELKIIAHRLPDNPGVWADNKKIAFIGIKLHKWAASHGLAFNIAPNLDYFKSIEPCGIKNCEITSLKELGINITNQTFDQLFKDKFKACVEAEIGYCC